MFTGISSGPVDLFESKELSSRRTSVSVVVISVRVGTNLECMALFCGGVCVSGITSIVAA